MKNYFASCLIIAPLLAIASCSSNSDLEVAEDAADPSSEEGIYDLSKSQFESSGMELGKIEMKPFHEIVRATGIFDVPPQYRASVSSYYGGTVKNLRLLPGEKVKKGQLLFSLENPDFVQMQQDFLEAKGELVYLKSDYERQKNLAADNVSSEKSLLKAESEYTVTKVKVGSLAKKLALMNINTNSLTIENIRTSVNITSPINGYVTQIDIMRGSFLKPSASAITIVNTDHLHLELNIFEKDLAKVSEGQDIRFRIQEDKSVDYAAEIHLVNKIIDPESRMIGIHGHLSDEKISTKFSPGMYVEADIYTSSESKASLPENALVEIEGKYYVLVFQSSTNDGYSFVKKEVKVAKSDNGYIEILNQNEFNDNTQFLIKGAFNLITE